MIKDIIVGEYEMKKIMSTMLAFCLLFCVIGIFIFGGAAKAVSTHAVTNPVVKKGVSTWDCIYFGNYYQSDKTGKKKDRIKWRVIQTDGKEALLLSDSILDIRQYVEGDSGDVEATWETSSLRTWLNTEFLNTAFDAEEKEGIKITKVVTPDNDVYNTAGGNATEDKIYVPTRQDMKNEKYGFSKNWTELSATRKVLGTNYHATRVNMLKVSETENITVFPKLYVLRTPGRTKTHVAFINGGEVYGGAGNAGGYNIMNYYAIRPMLRLDLSKTSLWKYAGTVNSAGDIVEYQYSSEKKENSSTTTGKSNTITNNYTVVKKVNATLKLTKPVIKKVSKVKKYKIKIEIKKVKGATGYQYRYATNKKMKKACKKSSKKKCYTTKKLKKKKKYYVSVRAYVTIKGKKYYGSWSKLKSVKTSK